MLVYHYTQLDVITSILRKDHILFWGTRYDSMNDPYDYLYAKNKIIPKLRDAIQDSDLKEKEKEYVELYPYIVSFSSLKDDFNMWRLYSANIALEFDWSKIKTSMDKTIYKSGKCVYVDDKDINKNFVKLFNQADQSDNILDTAQEQIAFMKNKSFKCEGEYRLICYDAKTFSVLSKGDQSYDICDCEIGYDIHFKCVRNNNIVFYKEFFISDKDALQGIILYSFDKNHFKSLKNQLQLWLISNRYNINNIKIRQTRSYPIR